MAAFVYIGSISILSILVVAALYMPHTWPRPPVHRPRQWLCTIESPIRYSCSAPPHPHTAPKTKPHAWKIMINGSPRHTGLTISKYGLVQGDPDADCAIHNSHGTACSLCILGTCSCTCHPFVWFSSSSSPCTS